METDKRLKLSKETVEILKALCDEHSEVQIHASTHQGEEIVKLNGQVVYENNIEKGGENND